MRTLHWGGCSSRVEIERQDGDRLFPESTRMEGEILVEREENKRKGAIEHGEMCTAWQLLPTDRIYHLFEQVFLSLLPNLT